MGERLYPIVIDSLCYVIQHRENNLYDISMGWVIFQQYPQEVEVRIYFSIPIVR